MPPQSEKVVSAVGDCVQFRGEVRSTLEELLQGQQEAQEEARRILDTGSVREAQQLFLIYQVGGATRTQAPFKLPSCG